MKPTNYYLVKIDRVAAWTLLTTMFIFIVSGYGMTKGIIDSSLAKSLHNDILPLIMLIAFLTHTFYAIRLAFIRWRIWSVGKPILIVVYLIFALGFVYFDQVYQRPVAKTNSQTQEATTEDSSQSSSATNDAQKVFTASELAKYNGQKGQPAYVAVDGVVYDLSGVFANGSHFSHLAGKELTDAFYSEHSKRQITKYPVVGSYQ